MFGENDVYVATFTSIATAVATHTSLPRRPNPVVRRYTIRAFRQRRLHAAFAP
jgi:hypothetical protein